MSNRFTNSIAIFLLILMFALGTTSMKDDSAIMDEVAHLPAGYSYLTQKDFRLNPEHPPLIKDLAALSLLFMPINFPAQLKSWTQEINSQWDFGFDFMYNSGNDADKMLFWGRLPILLLSLLLGFFVFKWARELYGNAAGLLALFLYSFSPTVLAHSRFVTTDIAATFGFFTAIYFFIRWLKSFDSAQDKQSITKNLIIAGLFFGIAQLLKFSLFMLVPFFIFLTFIWLLCQSRNRLKTALGLFMIFIIGYIIIFPIYQYHVWNYPVDLQQRDIRHILASDQLRGWSDVLVWMADKPVLRAYAQYLLGLTMVFQRAAGGNTTYFLGDVSNMGWKSYFPIVYAIKEPLAAHILIIIVLLYLAYNFSIQRLFSTGSFATLRMTLTRHFAEFAMLSFIGLYWLSSITSNLNIGVRHILPTFPFVFLLVSGQITKIFELGGKILKILIILLLAWYAAASFSIYPYYLAYFNELAGGANNGYLYVVDSNLDWGQDLKRLAQWVDKQNIEKIKVDYFGGGRPEYYLKEKFEEFHSDFGPQKAKGWLAVSATFYQTSKINPALSYSWLDAYKPITKIGYSIFVYEIK